MDRFLQSIGIESAFNPVNMATGANDGDWINLAMYGRVVCVLFKGIGTAGQDPVFTLKQATDIAGAGAKALNFTTIYAKVGTLTGVATFTRITQAEAATYTDAVSAEAAAIFAVEIAAEDLDVNNGFTCIQMSVPSVGAGAQLGCGFYIMLSPRYVGSVAPDAKV